MMMGGGNAPTWTQICSQYLTPQTCGGLGCHQEFQQASTGYTWLQSQGYISGTMSTMACLRGFGPTGNMPIIGSISMQGVTDIKAWIAAGAQND
jgi:hypothetical protein